MGDFYVFHHHGNHVSATVLALKPSYVSYPGIDSHLELGLPILLDH